MKFPAVALTCTLLTLSCQQTDKLPPPPPTDTRFQTSDPARIYFNNIRSTSYLIQDFSEKYTKRYTLSKWPEITTSPFIVPTIVDYWLYDQAYLELNWKGLTNDVTLPWRLICLQETTADTLQMDSRRWGAQYNFAEALHSIIRKPSHQFSLLLPDGTRLPVLDDPKVRRLFHTSWRDYKALTDKNKKQQ